MCSEKNSVDYIPAEDTIMPFKVIVARDFDHMSTVAARIVIDDIKKTLSTKDAYVLGLATGNTPTGLYKNLAEAGNAGEFDCAKIRSFNLDEYIGLEPDHPASFRRYLTERFLSGAGNLKAVNFIHGEAEDPASECRRIGALISSHVVDIALVGIGENGHLAFNDPPADFETQRPFIVVELDEVCRRQQLGEGWFAALEDVPRHAISMSIQQIMKSRNIIASVPESRKAPAVKKALEGPVTPDCPSSILQRHPRCMVFLDTASASLLKGRYHGGN